MYTIQSRCFENGYGTTCIISWVVWWCCGWSSPSRPPPSPSPSCSSSSASSGRLSSASLPDRFKVNCTILFHYIRQSNGLIQKNYFLKRQIGRVVPLISIQHLIFNCFFPKKERRRFVYLGAASAGRPLAREGQVKQTQTGIQGRPGLQFFHVFFAEIYIYARRKKH